MDLRLGFLYWIDDCRWFCGYSNIIVRVYISRKMAAFLFCASHWTLSSLSTCSAWLCFFLHRVSLRCIASLIQATEEYTHSLLAKLRFSSALVINYDVHCIWPGLNHFLARWDCNYLRTKKIYDIRMRITFIWSHIESKCIFLLINATFVRNRSDWSDRLNSSYEFEIETKIVALYRFIKYIFTHAVLLDDPRVVGKYGDHARFLIFHRTASCV